jgi:hypothetical protein
MRARARTNMLRSKGRALPALLLFRPRHVRIAWRCASFSGPTRSVRVQSHQHWRWRAGRLPRRQSSCSGCTAGRWKSQTEKQSCVAAAVMTIRSPASCVSVCLPARARRGQSCVCVGLSLHWFARPDGARRRWVPAFVACWRRGGGVGRSIDGLRSWRPMFYLNLIVCTSMYSMCHVWVVGMGWSRWIVQASVTF